MTKLCRSSNGVTYAVPNCSIVSHSNIKMWCTINVVTTIYNPGVSSHDPTLSSYLAVRNQTLMRGGSSSETSYVLASLCGID